MGSFFLCWNRPTREQQKASLNSSGDFNYDLKFRGASAIADCPLEIDLRREGFHLNHHRLLLGSGSDTYHRAKVALRSWRHFRLDWAFVNPETPLEKGTQFCVCVKEILPWLMMPLQVAYVADVQGKMTGCSNAKKTSFQFGSGTLQGHLLAGEERFSIEWDENDQVWYEIFSFSKPAHILAVIGYPYVLMRQKTFARQSSQAILKHIKSQDKSQDSS